MPPRIWRLSHYDVQRAKDLFSMMADVFEEEAEPLSDAYLARLLQRSEFWAIAAFVDDVAVGGLTAHALPMTKREVSEIMIYDLAVRKDRRRQGIGRQLVTCLLERADLEGIGTVFVPVDDDDEEARDFYRALSGVPSSVTMFDLRQGRILQPSEKSRGSIVETPRADRIKSKNPGA